MIREACGNLDQIGPQVRKGEYEIETTNGTIILPSTWADNVVPSWSLKMMVRGRQMIYFKDALGRKFNFPYDPVRSWAVGITRKVWPGEY